MQEKDYNFINWLPAEMVEEILGYLNPKELVTAVLASKATFFGRAQRQLELNKKCMNCQPMWLVANKER